MVVTESTAVYRQDPAVVDNALQVIVASEGIVQQCERAIIIDSGAGSCSHAILDGQAGNGGRYTGIDNEGQHRITTADEQIVLSQACNRDIDGERQRAGQRNDVSTQTWGECD